MRKIQFEYSTGYWDMDTSEIKEYPHDATNWQISQDAYAGAVANAALYGITLYNVGDEHSNDCPCFIGDNIQGTWKEIV